MNERRWQILKSKRAVKYRRKRKARKEGLLQFKRDKPKDLILTSPMPVKQVKALIEEEKIKPKEGIFRRVFRRITGA